MDVKSSKPVLRVVCLILIALVWSSSPVRSDSGSFLVIADIHFDPFFDGTLFPQLQSHDVEDWAAILETSRPAGFDPRGTDSNYALLKSSLDDVLKRVPHPDFILYPGDMLAHRWQARYDAVAPRSHVDDPHAYRGFTAKTIRFLAGQFRKRFPGTVVAPTLGNEDSYCGEYRIEPDGPFLAMFAETWAPLLSNDLDRTSFRATFSRGGYFTMKLPGTTRLRLIVVNTVFFSVNYDNACSSRLQTPAFDQFHWLDETMGKARAAGETVWLLMHVPPGINSQEDNRRQFLFCSQTAGLAPMGECQGDRPPFGLWQWGRPLTTVAINAWP